MTISTRVRANGIDFENPFIIGSGPPSTNKATISKAFREGWGGVVAKTISLDPSKVHNIAPRYGKLKAQDSGEVIGFENIELISDRTFDVWLRDFEDIKREHPGKVLIASIMEEYDRNAWHSIVKQVQDTGVDAFELNFSCPHGLPERKMGAAMGENPEIVREVTSWVMEVAKIPVWAKMTPNVGNITVPSKEAIAGGANGISLINTILSVIGVNLETLRPLPSIKGHTTLGGYSGQAVRPIALRHCLQLAQEISAMGDAETSISAMGGIENSAAAIEFLLLGATTVQSCTGPMLRGFKMVHELIAGLEQFMDKHGFKTIDEFRGKAVPYFVQHSQLVDLKQNRFSSSELSRDEQWSGDKITSQTDGMVSH